MTPDQRLLATLGFIAGQVALVTLFIMAALERDRIAEQLVFMGMGSTYCCFVGQLLNVHRAYPLAIAYVSVICALIAFVVMVATINPVGY